MALPFAAKAAIATTKLFSDLVTAPIAAELKPRDIALAQRAMYKDPLVLPDVKTTIDLLIRQMIAPELANGILRNHGVTLQGIEGDEHDGEYYDAAKIAWKSAVNVSKEIPGVREYVDWNMRGLLGYVPASRGVIRAGGNPEFWFHHLDRMRDRPSIGDVLQGYMTGTILRPRAAVLAQEAGSKLEFWDDLLPAKYERFSPVELIELRRRGLLDDGEFRRRVHLAGWGQELDRELWTELQKGIPQVADLVMMGIREAFRPELAQVYDYYSEFPELTRPWFGKLGLDYGTGIQINPKEGAREATLADLYWASHWHPMPLGQAYAAYQRFRPDQIARYQGENPNLKPFTRDDLLLHMRIADLPPGVRDWMVALGHQPLGVRGIQWGVRYLGHGADWATERYLDLGFVLDDAVTQAKIQVAREDERQRAWITSLEQSANKKLVALTESLYRDGLIDREQAKTRLTQMGIPELSAIQILDLQELEVQHALITGAVAATRKAFLSGEILAGDVPTQLGRFGVLPFRAQLYLQTWQIQFTQRRKRLETGKIATMVVEGLMSAADAKVRLGNLGWSDPDATLLLAEAAGKVAKLQAAEAKAGESAAQRRARELERLAKQAEAQSRKLRSEANRVAPRSVLMRWAKEHEIGEDSFRSMMRERGYPEGDIDLYWQEVVTPKPRAPRPAPTVRPFPRPPGSVHPTEAMVGKWYLTETINRSQYLDALKSLGYSAEDAERIVYNDDLKHGKAGTTEEPPSSPPAS